MRRSPRCLNEPKVDPEKGIPFSSRRLVDCLRTGAERFGWSSRNPNPGQVRAGDQWIGLGMAAASRSNVLAKSSARVTLTPELRVVVETDMTDIGTGTYSILAQISADLLGVPVTSVDVRLGDTDFPEGAGSGGSKAAASGCHVSAGPLIDTSLFSVFSTRYLPWRGSAGVREHFRR